MPVSPYREHVKRVAEQVRAVLELTNTGAIQDITGISHQTWWRIKTGARDIQLHEQLILCATFKMQITDLIELVAPDVATSKPLKFMRLATKKELQKIMNLSPSERDSSIEEGGEDWYIFSMLAADNLPDRSDEAFGVNAIRDIVQKGEG
ncbi:MAG: hypothetical protein ACFCBU_17780, partial [Cyanophyceae cyanobacterium]